MPKPSQHPKAFADLFSVESQLLIYFGTYSKHQNGPLRECLLCPRQNWIKLFETQRQPNQRTTLQARTITKKYKITRPYCWYKPFLTKFMHPLQRSINKYRLHAPFEKLPVDFEHKRYNLPHWCKITVHFFCVMILCALLNERVHSWLLFWGSHFCGYVYDSSSEIIIVSSWVASHRFGCANKGLWLQYKKVNDEAKL